tara:strand:- start:3898 stop:4941 length:1044 start_codon:yes stop_codon:yes gene_type:complete
LLIGNYKTSYKSDESIFSEWPKILGLVILVLTLIALPFFTSGYIVFLVTQVAVYTVAIVGLNILTGYTGLISLGHGALVGVGAYATAILANSFDLAFWFAIPLAILITALVGVFFGLPSLRIRGLYLTISTLAASFIIIFILEHWTSLTGGDSGMTLKPARIFSLEIKNDIQKYFFVLPFAFFSVLFAQNLFRGKIGRAFIAIRDADYSAEIIGIALVRYKLMSFALGAGYAGLAGSLWAYYFLAILPTQFELHLSILFLAALVVGGSSQTLGPVFGSVFVVLIPEILKWIMGFLIPLNPTIMEYTAPANTLVYGLLIICFMLFEPMGIAAIWTRFWNFVGRWPFSP